MFGIDDAIGAGLKFANDLIDRVIPDKTAQDAAKAKLLEMQLTGELDQQAKAMGLLQGQIDVNKIEAASGKFFIAAWRPFIGWVGGTGFAVQYVLVPLFGYFYALKTGHAGPPPIQLDPMLNEILFGLLGLSVGARTFEKVKGVA